MKLTSLTVLVALAFAGSAHGWDWCAGETYCNEDEDCVSDCWDYGSPGKNIGCGSGWYPHTCWYDRGF
ncbi:hypothetical protein ASPWEDRAFT_589223 [Aspergillus wentii DTO 134E9]|uniref:Uncharacterized protein n=1 Tax=Aspergillus wentii DTO 134E9 TaxID=1073089 RepID=A0A1L9RCQ9_ASPWE|nr:uncharacterized protein ASPWEDRAFT_589223 [Aspergillus wentii DTO 134E9]OJJ32678.1 hypothetical protein ASPWEDRAFT_589223 [Aspergillus wentii DTO 134E9]